MLPIRELFRKKDSGTRFPAGSRRGGQVLFKVWVRFVLGGLFTGRQLEQCDNATAALLGLPGAGRYVQSRVRHDVREWAIQDSNL